MDKIQKQTCKKCGGSMNPGVALQQNYSGHPDFIGTHDVVTISPNGTADVVSCLKCTSCGWSVK